MKKSSPQPTHRPSQTRAKPEFAKDFRPQTGLSPAVPPQRANMHVSGGSSALHRFWSRMRGLWTRLLDVVLLLGMAVIAFLAVAPKAVVMPTSFQMLLLAVVLVLISGFLVLLWRERPADEREEQNQALASRTAYTVGSIVLIVALTVQSFRHELDPFIPLALLAMIATKILVQRTKDGS